MRRMRSCTGLRVLNPAYQNPDRRGRAQATLGYTRRSTSDEKAYYIHRCSPAYQSPDRRGRAQATLGYTRRSRTKRLTFPTVSAFKSLNWGSPFTWGCQVLWIATSNKYCLRIIIDHRFSGIVRLMTGEARSIPRAPFRMVYLQC